MTARSRARRQRSVGSSANFRGNAHVLDVELGIVGILFDLADQLEPYIGIGFDAVPLVIVDIVTSYGSSTGRMIPSEA